MRVAVASLDVGMVSFRKARFAMTGILMSRTIARVPACVQRATTARGTGVDVQPETVGTAGANDQGAGRAQAHCRPSGGAKLGSARSSRHDACNHPWHARARGASPSRCPGAVWVLACAAHAACGCGRVVFGAAGSGLAPCKVWCLVTSIDAWWRE